MTINVKFLTEQQIERDALDLLEGYFHELNTPIQIPIPADEILETHLGLSLDFDDLRAVLGIPDVLGALWADKREVFIDQSLEPEEHPEMEGRYHFSVGHEIGHWRLHRQYLTNAGRQVAMFTDSQPEATVICRTSQAKKRIEWQADYFSSCFLMPRQSVLDAWSGRFGSVKPIDFADIADRYRTRRPVRKGMRMVGADVLDWVKQMNDPQGHVFDSIARELAPMFRVSIQAMRIRLENIGLLRVDHPTDQDLFAKY
jgi:Zn-dependent peptidase ImmA (M78 family)